MSSPPPFADLTERTFATAEEQAEREAITILDGIDA
jgi:hypothetical protein